VGNEEASVQWEHNLTSKISPASKPFEIGKFCWGHSFAQKFPFPLGSFFQPKQVSPPISPSPPSSLDSKGIPLSKYRACLMKGECFPCVLILRCGFEGGISEQSR
jgi:hypothetical protein